MEEGLSSLKLENHICFSLYSVSRLVIKQYKPLLEELNVTYPQYLVLLVLWENEEIPVKEISEKLFLETNTLTPLLKRMEANGIVERNRSKIDERSVIISLTPKGKELQQKAEGIPNKLAQRLSCIALEEQDTYLLKGMLDKILASAKEHKMR